MELALGTIPEFRGGSMVGMVSHGDDRGLHVEFFIEDVYQPFLSNKEGRAIYKPVEKVRVRGPASKSEFVTDVFAPPPGPEDQDKSKRRSWADRFPNQYAAFKSQQTQVPDGTPLEMAKFLASHRVKELKAIDVHTVEQYANMPDAVVATLGMGANREKALCQQFLGNDDEKVAQLSRALAENKVMQDDLQMLKDQLAQLNAQMASKMLHDPESNYKPYPETVEAVIPKRGPGRPPKQQESAE
jgi:hypothetical protein